jgi:hypothetical protein
MEPLCRETQGLRFFSLFKNIPPFLPFSLGMPLYRGIETWEGFSFSLPSPSRFSDLRLPSTKKGPKKGG